jgi:hypothetical protein
MPVSGWQVFQSDAGCRHVADGGRNASTRGLLSRVGKSPQRFFGQHGTESQYSLISLICPSFNWKTKQ